VKDHDQIHPLLHDSYNEDTLPRKTVARSDRWYSGNVLIWTMQKNPSQG